MIRTSRITKAIRFLLFVLAFSFYLYLLKA
jgi:hypothetical protein